MFVTVTSCVLFEVWTEFLNIIYMCIGFKGLKQVGYVFSASL
jgi:hypothetical protein